MTLHFIWWQGLKASPEAIQGNPAKWRKLNPGHKVKVWTGAAITRFVKREYPSYYAAFRRIGHNEAPNISIIKKCDFARLLILHHFGGAYIDLDCEPFRPLGSLLFSGEVHHRHTPFTYSREGSMPSTIPCCDPAPLQIDLTRYELIVSREHEMSYGEGWNAANTVMIAKAGGNVLARMIEALLPRAGMKVLDFAGPSGVTWWLRRNARKIRGKVLCIPPYYFLWQLHDMGPRWSKTICCHHNRLDWCDKSKEIPWDI